MTQYRIPDSSSLLIIRVAGMLLQLGITYFALSHFGSEGFGDFIQILVLTNLVSIPIQSGLMQSAARCTDSSEFLSICFSGLILFFVSTSTLWLWLKFGKNELNFLSYIFVAGYCFLCSVYALLMGVSRRLGDAISGVFAKQVAEPFLIIIFLFILSKISPGISLIEIYLLASLVSLLILRRYFRFIIISIPQQISWRLIKSSILVIINFSKISFSSHVIFSLPIIIISSYYSSTIVSAWRILEQLTAVVLMPHSIFAAVAHRDILVKMRDQPNGQHIGLALDALKKLRNIGLGLSTAAFFGVLVGSKILFGMLSNAVISWEPIYLYVIFLLGFAHLVNTSFGHIGLLLGVLGDEAFMSKVALSMTAVIIFIQFVLGDLSLILLAFFPLLFNFSLNSTMYFRLKGVSR